MRISACRISLTPKHSNPNLGATCILVAFDAFLVVGGIRGLERILNRLPLSNEKLSQLRTARDAGLGTCEMPVWVHR